tara:strand:- start:2096 stop:3241 length:1146 start_codon:yes stop_codon:yes gene_type:complete
MTYDFDTPTNRRKTGSLKWGKYSDGDVLPLWVADMDFKAAPEILEALESRLGHGVFGYTIPREEVEDSVINYMDRHHGYKIDRRWIFWSPGTVPALNLFCRAFGESDSSVMTATPVYPPFLTAPGHADKNLIQVDLTRNENRWTFDFEAMENALQPDTRSFILCNPHNPVGRVFSKTELEQLADFCLRHDLILCTDEIHSDLILESDLKHTTTNTISEEISQRSVMLTSPSKTYNLPGLCCAFAIIEDPKLRMAFKKVARGLITEINAFGYTGCQAAYDHGEAWRLELIEYLKSNRDFLYQYMAQKIPEIKIHAMEATYLAWMDVSELGLKDPTRWFEGHGVGLSDGTFFGSGNHVRLNFGCSKSVLENGLDRIAQAVSKI